MSASTPQSTSPACGALDRAFPSAKASRRLLSAIRRCWTQFPASESERREEKTFSVQQSADGSGNRDFPSGNTLSDQAKELFRRAMLRRIGQKVFSRWQCLAARAIELFLRAISLRCNPLIFSVGEWVNGTGIEPLGSRTTALLA
jgi:hypothetical protein